MMPKGLIVAIREAGMKVGIALKPKTPASMVFDYVDQVVMCAGHLVHHAHVECVCGWSHVNRREEEVDIWEMRPPERSCSRVGVVVFR